MPQIPKSAGASTLPGSGDPILGTRRLKLSLAQNVTAARRRAGLTQLQLAEAAELSRATVHLIEAGLCDPRLSTITRLATALQTDTNHLLAKGN